MAAYNKTIITAKGQALIAKSMVNTDVSFTKVVTSDKDYTSKGNLENLTDIENIKQSEVVSEVKVLNKTAVQVIAAFSNSLLTTGYYLRTIGLYATDPDEGEILYSITTALVPDWIPPFGNISITSFEVKLETIVSNSGNIDLNVSPTALVNVSQFKEFKEQVVSQLSDNTKKINELSITKANQSSLDTVSKKVENLDNTKANKNTIWNMDNMGQDVKEAMTGGSVAVVGKDSVSWDSLIKELKACISRTPEKTIFNIDGSIKEIYLDGNYKITMINNEIITETWYSEGNDLLLTKNTVINVDGSISETLV